MIWLASLAIQTRIAIEQIWRDPNAPGTHITLSQALARQRQLSKRCQVQMVGGYVCQPPLSKDTCVRGEAVQPTPLLICSSPK